MPITVIVPAYRAERVIGPCIDALFDADFAPGEIVVVDDGSLDGTVEAVRAKGIEPLRLPGNQGAARARNAGAEVANGDLLFFVDSDVLVHADVRTRIEAFFARHPDHAGLIGSYDAHPAHPGRVSRIRNLLHHHVHQVSAGDQPTFWTGCGVVRRADFDHMGGFRTEHERIEDVGLGLALARAGREVRLDPDLLCTHLKHWTLRDMAVTDYRHRAIPWTRMLSDPRNVDIPPALNAGLTGRLSVGATALSILGLLAAPFTPGQGLGLVLLAILALVGINLGFLVRVWRLGGGRDALAAIGVLWVHYLCAGAGYARTRLLG